MGVYDLRIMATPTFPRILVKKVTCASQAHCILSVKMKTILIIITL